MKLKSIIYGALGALLLGGCTDLTEHPYDTIPAGEYGRTPSEVATIVGRAYASLRGGNTDNVQFFPTCEFVFFVPSVASDECVIPTRIPGKHWFDDGVYLDIHRHQWKVDSPKVWSLWKYGFNGVGTVNSVIDQVEQSGLDAEASKPIFAELKCLRAYYYYKLLDWFGNVPLQTSFSVTEAPANSTRAEIFAFIEKELTDNIEFLPSDAYGRFTQNAAWMLLARLYLNAGVFTGKARWDDCLAACGKIKGALESDYFASFKTQNQNSKEIVLSIPYDRKAGTLGNYLSSMTFHYEQAWAISSSGNYPWCGNGISAQPGLWSSFDEKDIRRRAIVTGPQIDLRTGSIIVMPISGNPLIYTEEITDIAASPENEGGRLGKYEVLEGEQWERDHDWVLMRYAEALMMQAECHVRLGNASAARPYIEPLRTRAGLATPDAIDLDFIDKELRREFVFEDHRRTDNIRFGTFFAEWWSKEADPADHHTALFPIPAQEMAKNGKLKQNPGY